LIEPAAVALSHQGIVCQRLKKGRDGGIEKGAKRCCIHEGRDAGETHGFALDEKCEIETGREQEGLARNTPSRLLQQMAISRLASELDPTHPMDARGANFASSHQTDEQARRALNSCRIDDFCVFVAT
jgi:hypothetical protein